MSLHLKYQQCNFLCIYIHGYNWVRTGYHLTSNLIKPVTLCLTYVQCITLAQHCCLHSALVIGTSRIRSESHEGDNPEYFAGLFGHDKRPCYQNAWRRYSPILDKRTREHLPTPTGTSQLCYQVKRTSRCCYTARVP